MDIRAVRIHVTQRSQRQVRRTVQKCRLSRSWPGVMHRHRLRSCWDCGKDWRQWQRATELALLGCEGLPTASRAQWPRAPAGMYKLTAATENLSSGVYLNQRSVASAV